MIELTTEELKQHFSGSLFKRISETADELGLECYVVGGYVRDIFLQRPSKDIDVVVVGSGIAMAEALGKRLGRGAHVSVFKNFGTAQVKFHGTEVEFVGARRESYQRNSRKPIVEDGTLEDDQNRRDFTINALAVCLNQVRFGGSLRDDPLRMLRCIRFATQLNFYIDDDTFESLCRNCERISIISKERIADELNKILLSPIPSKGLIDLDRSGLLALIFPELVALQGVEVRNGRAHKDNFYHTLEVLDNISRRRSDSARRRLLFEAGDDIDDLMTLCEADITSKNMERKQRFLNNFQLVRRKLKDLEERDRIRNFQPPVSGEEIMKTFNLEPCQLVGALKSAIKDAILVGVIPNEYEAARAFMLQRAEKMGLKCS